MNIETIYFTNIQLIKCKINYQLTNENNYNVDFFIFLEDQWIQVNTMKIKKGKFTSFVEKYKITYEYNFNCECELEITGIEDIKYQNYLRLLNYEEFNKLISNNENIPYLKTSGQNCIYLISSKKNIIKLKQLCETKFTPTYEVNILNIF
jgi:hypothetical protein